MMIHYLQTGAAVLLAAIILVRVICVIYPTTRAKHKHPVMFYGFGYSYVALGAGAVAAAIAICADPTVLGMEVDRIAIWTLLVASVGLIIFDRRAASCWSVTECPMKRGANKP